MAQRQKTDIYLYQGDTKSYKFTVYTDAAQTTEWDFSGASAVAMSIKSTLDASAVLISASATDGANGNDWANGVAVFTIPAADSALLTRNGVYDVQITIGSAKTTVVYGDVLLQRQVTG